MRPTRTTSSVAPKVRKGACLLYVNPLTVLLDHARHAPPTPAPQPRTKVNMKTNSIAAIALIIACFASYATDALAPFSAARPADISDARKMLEDTNAQWKTLERDLNEMDGQIAAYAAELAALKQQRLIQAR
jgi:hypothetical protein